MKEPLWLQEAVVTAIHSRQLAEHGGLDGVRDLGMLASSLARPKSAFAYSQPKADIPALAAAYAFGIVKNHPFVDGNKRTAYVLCRTFLKLNGKDVHATDVDKYKTFLGVADGTIAESQLADWIRSKLE
jgi:death-on-curing protein